MIAQILEYNYNGRFNAENDTDRNKFVMHDVMQLSDLIPTIESAVERTVDKGYVLAKFNGKLTLHEKDSVKNKTVKTEIPTHPLEDKFDII